MASSTIMVVDLAVAPSRREEFDAFYHDFYIPEFLKALPEIATARRFAQTNAENRNGKVHYLTVYELIANGAILDVENAIARSAHREASDQFKLWKNDGLTHFDREFYAEAFLSELECPTNELWKFSDLCALFWKMPSASVSIENIHLAREITVGLTTSTVTGAGRTYECIFESPADDLMANYMTILTAKDQISLSETISNAEQILKPHTRRADFNHSPGATIALQLIYSHSRDDTNI